MGGGLRRPCQFDFQELGWVWPGLWENEDHQSDKIFFEFLVELTQLESRKY